MTTKLSEKIAHIEGFEFEIFKETMPSGSQLSYFLVNTEIVSDYKDIIRTQQALLEKAVEGLEEIEGHIPEGVAHARSLNVATKTLQAIKEAM